MDDNNFFNDTVQLLDCSCEIHPIYIRRANEIMWFTSISLGGIENKV